MYSEVKIIKGRDDWQFAVFDPKTPTAAVEYVRRRNDGRTSLWLEMGGVHNHHAIESLTSVPGIDGVMNIHVMGSGWEDLGVVQELQHIRKLNIGFERSRFDFANFANLQEISGVWSPFWLNLNSCKNLRCFFVSKFSDSLEHLPNASALSELGFIQPRFESLGGLGRSPCLRSLEISHGTRLKDISALADVSKTLEFLELNLCRKVSSFEVIEQLEMLQTLTLTDCSPLPSIGFVHGLPRLRDLNVYGTVVVDSDLSYAAQHHNLRSFRAESRRSYEPAVKAVSAALATRQHDA